MALITSKRLYLSLPVLSKESRLKPSIIEDGIVFKEKLYRYFEIPKRKGGSRTISVPPPSLALLQRKISNRINKTIKFPECVNGYVKGRSIITNAKMHLGGKHFIQLDLRDFFQNIKIQHVREGLGTDFRGDETLAVISMICFLKNRLPQGAPSSPVLSNLAARKLDEKLTLFSEENSFTYSRYADDITISGQVISLEQYEKVQTLIRETGYELNNKKSRLITEGRKVIVTGISIGSGKMHLPRIQKRELRKQAHYLRANGALVESTFNKDFDPFHIDRILGKLSFWASVEPENKFPARLIDEIKENAKVLGFLS